jgi:bifunctional DNase/RNase
MVEVRVSGLAVDDRNKSPVVILEEKRGTRVLPIWIGPSEASGIARDLAGRKFERPLTHDLTKSILDGLQATIEKILITELESGTFFAKIIIHHGKEEMLAIDARPSDSIALALRAKAVIFADEGLFSPDTGEEDLTEDEKAERLRQFLRDLPPEDFGRAGL